MKTTFLNSAMRIAMIISIFMATSACCAQKQALPDFYLQSPPPSATVNIYIDVNVKALFETTPPNNNIEQYCVLSDDGVLNGQPASTPSTSIDIPDHVTQVYNNNEVIWHLRRSNSPAAGRYKLTLHFIYMKQDNSDENIFVGNPDPIEPETGEFIIKGRVKDLDDEASPSFYKYSIHFSIEYGGVIKHYRLDPELKANT